MTRDVETTPPCPPTSLGKFDAIVIGAGFAGLHMLHRLRESGFSAHGFETGSGVGGTWYWNRYPGARCDSDAMFYSYSFLSEIEQEWPHEERYPRQETIVRYLELVADRLDLRKDFTFDTRVDRITYDEPRRRWVVASANGIEATARFVITAVGGLSAPNLPRYPGAETFRSECYHTGSWPHEPVSFADKRVGVLGTGSSGVQVIPEIAKEAAQLTVFQRTPNYVIPAVNGALDPQVVAMWKANYQEIRRRTRKNAGGMPYPRLQYTAAELSPEQQRSTLEAGWQRGGVLFVTATFSDSLTNMSANTVVADFVRSKIDEIVEDPQTARKLKPTTHPWATKRVPVGTNYYETFNRPNVSLVDLRDDPVEEITPSGIRTRSGDHPLDAIVYATGYDALTGSLLALNICGRGGERLATAWEAGPRTYLGLMVPNFPNLFTITGPGSPSVLTNVPAATEQHVEWVAELLNHLRARDVESIEPTEDATTEWTQHVEDVASETLYPLADSWYMGANIPGKPRRFLAYLGGLDTYAERCGAIAADGYRGFELAAAADAGPQEVLYGAR